MTAATTITVAELVDRARALRAATAHMNHRVVIGITGPPGAGKSALMAAVLTRHRRLDDAGVIGLPLDGFHLRNSELLHLGLTARKGAPETFNANNYYQALKVITEDAGGKISWPEYSRISHDPVADAIHVLPTDRLIFIEGNYLLLPERPWSEAQPLFTEIWYVSAPAAVLVQRLIRRQLSMGVSKTAAAKHVIVSDMANIQRVESSQEQADLTLTIDGGDPGLRSLIDPASQQPFLFG